MLSLNDTGKLKKRKNKEKITLGFFPDDGP